MKYKQVQISIKLGKLHWNKQNHFHSLNYTSEGMLFPEMVLNQVYARKQMEIALNLLKNT